MSAEVIELDCVTRLDLPAERVLENAKGDFERVFLVGYDADGELQMRSTFAGGAELLWLLRVAERKLLDAAGV